MQKSKFERFLHLSGKAASKALETLEQRGIDIREKLATPIDRVPRRAPQKPKPTPEG
ncbi:MAG TPA: hypothetical protein VND87_15260 [Stellaceae bacterium]|nr:hypothetical protein [Stellaceae bacterium]